MLEFFGAWLARLAPWMVIGSLAYAAVFIKPSVNPVPLDQPLIEHRDAFFDGAAYADHLWIVGQNGALLSSGDGGRSWQREELPQRDNLQSVAVSPAGQKVVVGNRGQLWTRSLEGEWQHRQLPVSELAGKLQSVRFLDGHFWAVGEMGALFRGSADAADWQALGVGEDINFNGIGAGADGDLWIAAEFGRLLRSRDHGRTWDSLELGDESLRAVHFAGRTGVAVGNRGQAFVSRDGGDSWQPIERFTSEHLFDVVERDGLWVTTGARGALFRSRSPAGSWQAWSPEGLDLSYHNRLLATAEGVVLIGQQLGLLRDDALHIWPGEQEQ
ncbi:MULTISPECIES: YCF48-related protein [unclassified Pseudomonas]|uniref:YCF48-related protein n=1 Tax=unclassified Pseudomonas TaxID=196821 RepID=UPI00244A31F2|nr:MULTISPECIES: YCF48-related protein [unclassified Pseudomonas]MDH0893403.1 YCF48-related protein [Pseudomonas sp. GD03875]MDH1066257.1 YCF48-related protein [Pseudomonas sp. GD03985]